MSRPLTLLALLLLCAVLPAHAATDALTRKLDPRLRASLAATAAPAPVWIEFADKGEQGPADLAERLARAERELTPRNRARREKAGMRPLVDYLDLPLEPSYVAALRARGLVPYGQSRWFNRVAVHVAGAPLAALADLPFVARLAPVEQGRVQREPTPPTEEPLTRPIGTASATGTTANTIEGQTYTQLQRLGVTAMRDSGYVGTGVLICMLDDGFNYQTKHTATRNIRVLARRDFVEGDTTVTDTVTSPSSFQHGQMTLSTVGGNAPYIYRGPACGASFMLGRTEYDPTETPIEMTNWAMGVEWADSAGADIISSSLGYNVFDAPYPSITNAMLDGHTAAITRAAEIAASRGILVVNSAGNDGTAYKIAAPSDANGDSVLCVGAVDSSGVRAGFSSMGPTADKRIKPDLAAQGVSVLVASASGGANSYSRVSGTSFSCPLTAGLAACMMQARPSWPAVLIIRALKKTASKASSPDTLYGCGIPNGLAALRWVNDTAGVPESPLTGLTFACRGANPLRAGAPTRLHFGLGAAEHAGTGRIRAYDAQGRVVAHLWNGPLAPGASHDLEWRGTADDGGALRPGLYLVSLETPGRRAVVRLAILK